MSKPLADYTKDELLDYIHTLKQSKKFGLVWEDKPEQVATDCETNLPVIEEVSARTPVGPNNAPAHLIIEGDNYHSLSVLNYTHAGKVDVIYIDPPYNTGKKDDFHYNDDYVDSEDEFRHSKWLSFMQKRLELAKTLLSENGVIFISIDDHEYARLKVLCDEIFFETNLIGTLLWQRAKGGGNSKKVVRGHDYILCYTNGADITLTQKGEKAIDHIKKWKTGKYPDRYKERDDGLYFLNDDVVRRVFGKYEAGTERRCEYENLLEFKGQKAKDEIDIKLESGEYVLKPTANGLHFICRPEKVADMRQVLYTIIQGFLSEVGVSELDEMRLGAPFGFPKPLGLIKILVDSVPNKNALVLDFFAGSGTTGHAVLDLNKDDGGRRQFILCTNNENNIAETITYQRIKKVTEGYADKPAIPANVRYFKTDFVSKRKTDDQTRHALVERCADMIRVRENTFETVLDTENLKIFKNSTSYTAVIFNPLAIAENIKTIENTVDISTPVNLYVFSYSSYTYLDDIPKTPLKYTVKSIPESILEVYQRIFKAKDRV